MLPLSPKILAGPQELDLLLEKSTTPASGNTCGRGARTHGDVLNAHTEGVLNVHMVPLLPFLPSPSQHTHIHYTTLHYSTLHCTALHYTTLHNTTQHNTTHTHTQQNTTQRRTRHTEAGRKKEGKKGHTQRTQHITPYHTSVKTGTTVIAVTLTI